MGFTKIWVADLNSQRKNYPMKEFRAIFSDFIDFQVRVSISVLAVLQNYGTYINLGCRFEFRTQKLPYERISGKFFLLHRKKIISQY